MFVITGITGKVGGIIAERLLQASLPVRAVVRNQEKGAPWAKRGCEIFVAPTLSDGNAMAEAFNGADGVFLMSPPNYDPAPDFPDTRGASAAIGIALRASRPKRLVYLSTVGAHVAEFNLLNNSAIFEDMLRRSGVSVALLRAAWFMENAAWDLSAACTGEFDSYLQPLDHKIDMVSTPDIGRVAAELLRESWGGVRVVELAGPSAYSAQDVAAGFAAALGRSVIARPVPRSEWESRFRSQGMVHPQARIRMLDGFNEGWIRFELRDAEQRTGTVSLETVLRNLVARSNAAVTPAPP